MINRNRFWLTFFCAVWFGCTTTDQKKEKSLNIYMEYMISGEEGLEMVTGLLQFRAGKNGPNIKLKEPAKVELDGEVLQWDTAGMSGTFYEFQQPLAEFAGEHTIVFTDTDGKQYKEQFTYTPFSIGGEIGEQVRREDLVLRIEGMAQKEPIKVVLSDTSFFTEGVNEWDTVENGQLDMRNQLNEVSNGPVVLQLYKESEKYIKNGSSVIGKISVSYGLKREFELTD